MWVNLSKFFGLFWALQCIMAFVPFTEGKVLLDISPRHSALDPTSEFPARWFRQRVDHFSSRDFRTFRQRFYVNHLHWDPLTRDAPIFLYINGEGPVNSPPYLDDDEVVLLAKKYHGLIVTLEHRFYGESQPFDTWDVQNLRYLNSRQALADLAHFISFFRSQVEKKKPTPSSVFTIGGSYAGALSAWFRVKYPHMTVGSISSSGVVNAILEFSEFDEQVALSVEQDCSHVLKLITKNLEQLILYSDEQTKLATKEMFKASILTIDGDFFLMMADAMAEPVQYGFQDDLCFPLIESYKLNGESMLVNAFANFTVNFWMGFLGNVEDYCTASLQNTTVDSGKAGRQWLYQTCSEFGWFQIAPQNNSIRSQMVNITYYRELCRSVFGRVALPDVNATNELYGGEKIGGTRIFFVNGSQDPWKRASILTTFSESRPSETVVCHNCGHAVDIRGCPNGCDNQENLQAVRDSISNYVSLWLRPE